MNKKKILAMQKLRSLINEYRLTGIALIFIKYWYLYQASPEKLEVYADGLVLHISLSTACIINLALWRC